MKQRSLFWPLTLILTGVIWLLVSMNIIPAANLWALTHIWPYALIALGVGLILKGYLPALGWIVPALIVIGASMAVIYAPRLGWIGGPNWIFGSDFGGGVPGSGMIETEMRTVEDVLAVTIDYPAEVIIQQGKTELVKIEADDNLLPQLATEAHNGLLLVENTEALWDRRVNPTERVKITITVKDLHQIDFYNSGNLEVNGLKTDVLNLSVNGAGEIALNDLDTHKLEVGLNGAGYVQANGIADELNLVMNGAGDFEAPNLETMIASVHSNGASSATIRVKDDLTAILAGSGSVDYYGSPVLHEEIVGAASLTKMDD